VFVKAAAARCGQEEIEAGIVHAEMGIHHPAKSPSELFTLLNNLGDEGWELVTLLTESVATPGQIVAKRPKEKAWSKPSDSSQV
jgi:hypothetical protein